MHDFPPAVDAYTKAQTSRPDTRSPTRFLVWLLRVQADVVAAMAVAGLFWFLPGALSPLLLGKAIDVGVLRGDAWATIAWAAVLTCVILIGAAAGITQHTLAVRGWLIALYGTCLLYTSVQGLRPIAEEMDLTMAQLAVAWVLQNEAVACAIIGASRPRQITENVAASGVVIPPEMMSRIDDVLGDVVVRNPMLTRCV